jgi:hypothetical protein
MASEKNKLSLTVKNIFSFFATEKNEEGPSRLR